MKKIVFLTAWFFSLWIGCCYLTFVQAATISGKITLSNQTADNFSVAVYNELWEFVVEVNTDSNGAYQVQVDSGSYYLYAYSLDSNYMAKYYSQFAQAYVYDLATQVSVDDSINATDIDLSMAILGTITGQISDDAKATSLADFIVRVYDENSLQVSWNVTDEEGNYSFSLDPGNYYIYTYDPSGFYTNQTFAGLVSVSESSTTPDINMALQVAAISIFSDKASYTTGESVLLSVGMSAAEQLVDIYIVIAFPDGKFRSLQGDLSLSSDYTVSPLISGLNPVDLNPPYALYSMDTTNLPTGSYGVYITLAYNGFYPGYLLNQYAFNLNSFTVSSE